MTLSPAENVILKELARKYQERRAAADHIPRSDRSILRRLDKLRTALDRVDLP